MLLSTLSVIIYFEIVFDYQHDVSVFIYTLVAHSLAVIHAAFFWLYSKIIILLIMIFHIAVKKDFYTV